MAQNFHTANALQSLKCVPSVRGSLHAPDATRSGITGLWAESGKNAGSKVWLFLQNKDLLNSSSGDIKQSVQSLTQLIGTEQGLDHNFPEHSFQYKWKVPDTEHAERVCRTNWSDCIGSASATERVQLFPPPRTHPPASSLPRGLTPGLAGANGILANVTKQKLEEHLCSEASSLPLPEPWGLWAGQGSLLEEEMPHEADRADQPGSPDGSKCNQTAGCWPQTMREPRQDEENCHPSTAPNSQTQGQKLY